MRGDGITPDFVLAEKLGMSVGEIRALPNVEYSEWVEYYTVKRVLQDLAHRTAVNRGHH